MNDIIAAFKERHGIDKIVGLMMLHYFKWPWCLEDLTQYVDEIYLILHYSPEFKADWPATTALMESGIVGEKIEGVAGDIVGSMLQLSVICLIVSLFALAFAYLWPLRHRVR